MAAPPPHHQAHQAPPVHMAQMASGPPMDMRAPPIGEPRNVMGDPRVPMMEPRAPPMETRGTAALTMFQSDLQLKLIFVWFVINLSSVPIPVGRQSKCH